MLDDGSKNIDTVTSQSQIATGVVEDYSDDAWAFRQEPDDEPDFLPKSWVIVRDNTRDRRFRIRSERILTVVEMTVNQTTLSDYETDSAPLYLNVMLIDEVTGNTFELRIHGDSIALYPAEEEIDPSSFLHFFETVTDEIDPDARIVNEEN